MTQEELLQKLVEADGAILYWQLPREAVAQVLATGLCRIGDDDCLVHHRARKIADGAYTMEPDDKDPLGRLCYEYAKWNKANGLDLGSADEHTHDEDLTEEQRAYLRSFCERWDAVEEADRASDLAYEAEPRTYSGL